MLKYSSDTGFTDSVYGTGAHMNGSGGRNSGQRNQDSRYDDINELEALYRDMQKEFSSLAQSYALNFEAISGECEIDINEIDAAVEELYPVIESAKDNLKAELDDRYGEEE